MGFAQDYWKDFEELSIDLIKLLFKDYHLINTLKKHKTAKTVDMTEWFLFQTMNIMYIRRFPNPSLGNYQEKICHCLISLRL